MEKKKSSKKRASPTEGQCVPLGCPGWLCVLNLGRALVGAVRAARKMEAGGWTRN